MKKILKTIFYFAFLSFILVLPLFYKEILRIIIIFLVLLLQLMNLFPIPFDYFIIFIAAVFFSYKTIRLFKEIKVTPKRKTIFLKISTGIISFYAIFLFLFTISRYYNFSSETIDLSYYHHTVWQLSQFKIPRIWDIPERFVWGDHFEPILFLLVPFYWIKKDAVILMIFQAGIVISGTIPLFLLVKEKLKNSFLAFSLTASYLLFGGLQMGYAYGFHPIVIFPTIFFWTYYFLEKNKKGWYFLFLILLLFIKEEVAFTTFFLGIYLLLVKRKVSLSFFTLLISSGWYFLCFHLIFPYFTTGAGFGHWGQYGELGTEGVFGIIKNFFFKPDLFFKTLITPIDKINTFFHTFGSFAFLPFLYPLSLIIVIPSFLEKFLSSNIARFNGFHYSAVIAGVVLISSIESLNYLFKKKLNSRFLFIRNPLFWSLLILFVSIFANVFYGYEPLSLLSLKKKMLLTNEHIKSIYQIIDSLPKEASVSAQYQLAPYISRPLGRIRPAPNKNENSDYIILDKKLPLVLTIWNDYYEYLIFLEKNPNYELITEKDGILVLKKTNL